MICGVCVFIGTDLLSTYSRQAEIWVLGHLCSEDRGGFCLLEQCFRIQYVFSPEEIAAKFENFKIAGKRKGADCFLQNVIKKIQEV